MPPRTAAPTVYLDTQDFSRFGGVIRGKSDPEAAEIFERLRSHAVGGSARFVYSMATLSELLQFHPEYEETSLAKARAIELLCRGHAMANFSRLVAGEVASFAYERGLMCAFKPAEFLCSEDYWFPSIGNAFDTFRPRFERARQDALEEFAHMNRQERRRARKGLSDRAFKKFADETAREVEEHYGVAPGGFGKAFGLYARGKMSSGEASTKLFSSIAKPTAFIHFYFHKYEGEKDLPAWMRSFGEAMQTLIEGMVDQLASYDVSDLRRMHPIALDQWKHRLAETIAGFALKNGNEFGMSDDVVGAVQARSDILNIQCCGNLVGLIGEYVAQCVGLRGTMSKVEPSFGGDLIHAMYIPHVDIWRSDRRFSKLVEDCGIQGSTCIVPTLSTLPEAIASLQ